MVLEKVPELSEVSNRMGSMHSVGETVSCSRMRRARDIVWSFTDWKAHGHKATVT